MREGTQKAYPAPTLDYQRGQALQMRLELPLRKEK